MIPLSESILCIPCGKYSAVTHEKMAGRRKIAMLKKGRNTDNCAGESWKKETDDKEKPRGKKRKWCSAKKKSG